MLSFFLFPPLCRTFENDRPKHTFKNINQKVLLLLKYKYLNKKRYLKWFGQLLQEMGNKCMSMGYESLKIRVFKQFCKTTIIRYVLKNAEMGNKCMPIQ